jgi:hypothetical protein
MSIDDHLSSTTNNVTNTLTNIPSIESPSVMMSSLTGGKATAKREQGQIRALLGVIAYMSMATGRQMSTGDQYAYMVNSVSNHQRLLDDESYVLSLDGHQVDLNQHATRLPKTSNPSNILRGVIMRSTLEPANTQQVTGKSRS